MTDLKLMRAVSVFAFACSLFVLSSLAWAVRLAAEVRDLRSRVAAMEGSIASYAAGLVEAFEACKAICEKGRKSAQDEIDKCVVSGVPTQSVGMENLAGRTWTFETARDAIRAQGDS